MSNKTQSESHFQGQVLEQYRISGLFFDYIDDGDRELNMLQKMQQAENRYACENNLIRSVCQGDSCNAEALFCSLWDSLSPEPRSDLLRSEKNRCIVINTLLRRAAESAGVHPIYIENISSKFMEQIEFAEKHRELPPLGLDMVRTYCSLVKHHSISQYPLPVQRAIIQIDSGLGTDLSLKTLSRLQNINASYLSNLFHREVGLTVTEYTIRRRMELAQQLLHSTKLQIQTIAQHCGIPDVNYFSKLFKKHLGISPRQFREKTYVNRD